MSIAAVIPLADLPSANASLEAQGFGPGNFSVPLYGGVRATFAALHVRGDPALEAAVKAVSNVQWSDVGDTGKTRLRDVLSGLGVEWGGDAPALEGQVTPGLYRDGLDLWWVIQAFDRSVFTQPLTDLPSLVRPARIPGVPAPWVQPLDQSDAYKLVDPFTGEGELATHNGSTWRVVQADGAGNNIWAPGVYGWEVVA